VTPPEDIAIFINFARYSFMIIGEFKKRANKSGVAGITEN
jgi:hypothetical protein